MDHFRDQKAGEFYVNKDDNLADHFSEAPPFLRLAEKHGVAADLWKDEDGIPEGAALSHARLDWPVQVQDVLTPSDREPGGLKRASHYRALVRPDTDEVMSVMLRSYRHAENAWVASAAADLSRRINSQKNPLVAAVGYGRDNERTLFAARITGDTDYATCLLVYNTHGGEGAVKFQIVEVSRLGRTVYVLGNRHAFKSITHVGDMQERLDLASTRGKTFVEEYLDETQSDWERLANTLWTPRHTTALLAHLWGETPSLTPRRAPNGNEVPVPEPWHRHPGHRLPMAMREVTDAALAYRTICYYLDNESEACERGDFTKDRDERLALGAGNRYKRNAWRWILSNT